MVLQVNVLLLHFLHRPPVRCDVHLAMLDAAHDHLVPAGLQFKEFPVHKGELVVSVVQAPVLVNVLFLTIDDKVVPHHGIMGGDGHSVDGDRAALRAPGEAEPDHLPLSPLPAVL